MNEAKNFSALDRQFGNFVERLHGAHAPELKHAAMCVSRSRAEGHICLPLQEIEIAADVLRASKVVGAPGQFAPLVLDQRDRLYLRRYWEYEQQLARAILDRVASTPPKIDQRKLTAELKKFFPAAKKGETDWQQIAASKALTSNFTVITGGPGTGKTRTVVAILALLLAQPGGEELRIALAAPTGKAAARLTESLRAAKDKFGSALPDDATTIHRLLGAIPDSPYFRHNAERPLLADVVIIDEASMVDLALMAKLVDAVPIASRLILLGDRDQLASVEAGNVLSDICHAAQSAGNNTPLRKAVVELRRNYRFAETGGIFTLSNAVNAGDTEAATAVLLAPASDEITRHPLPPPEALLERLRERIVTSFRACLEESNPAAALAQLQQFRILCALRHGPFGVENLNAVAEEILADAGLLVPFPTWYRGRPVMITRNDYNLQLFNGDSGIILPDPEAGAELRAFFLSAEGKLRRFLPSRLPRHETAFALTVHKSQGSEFDRLLLILPSKDSPVLTRELLYTAITRARTGAEIWCADEVFRAAVLRRTRRTSGLRDALGVR